MMADRILSCKTVKCLTLGKGNKVKNLRMLKKLTIKELAEFANISEEHLKSLECQKIELINSDLIQVANSLDIDVELLLDSSMCLDNQDLYLLNSVLQNYRTELDISQLQIQVMNLINVILHKKRKQWNEMRQDSISALCKSERKERARYARKLRDKKYAPFREYFKQVQYEKFIHYHRLGKILSANSFVMWYLAYKSEEMHIPYVKQNTFNKLVQLAQKNNREFKKLLRVGADMSIVVAD